MKIGRGYIAASFYDYFGQLATLKPCENVDEDEDGDDGVIPSWAETLDMEAPFPLAHWSEQTEIHAAKEKLASLMLGAFFDDEDEEDSDTSVPSWAESPCSTR